MPQLTYVVMQYLCGVAPPRRSVGARICGGSSRTGLAYSQYNFIAPFLFILQQAPEAPREKHVPLIYQNVRTVSWGERGSEELYVRTITGELRSQRQRARGRKDIYSAHPQTPSLHLRTDCDTHLASPHQHATHTLAKFQFTNQPAQQKDQVQLQNK